MPNTHIIMKDIFQILEIPTSHSLIKSVRINKEWKEIISNIIPQGPNTPAFRVPSI